MILVGVVPSSHIMGSNIADNIIVADVGAHLQYYTSLWSFMGPVIGLEPTLAQSVLLFQAAVRYEVWLDKVLTSRDPGPITMAELPPFDVLIPLHAHMLSPHHFFKDAGRPVHEALQNIGKFPYDLVVRLVCQVGPMDV